MQAWVGTADQVDALREMFVARGSSLPPEQAASGSSRATGILMPPVYAVARAAQSGQGSPDTT